jgi:hypothetical protein
MTRYIIYYYCNVSDFIFSGQRKKMIVIQATYFNSLFKECFMMLHIA